jgi:soluble lytic murein transglycosylase-like protein
MQNYVVKPGDTLSGIYGDNWKQTSGYTGDPKKLPIGAVLPAPASSNNNFTPAQSPLQSPVIPVPESSFSSVANNSASLNHTPSNFSPTKQPNWIADQAKKISNAVVPQAYAAEKPPERKTFNVDMHPDAISSPGYVNGTPDWVKPIIQKAAEKHNIPPMLLSALLKQESGFNPRAGSSAGAQGIAQFMPDTAKGMGIDPYDPESAIMGAAQYLRRSWDKFGKPELALAAYNAGGGAVNQYGGIPPYKETQNYVKNIMAMAGELHQSAHGPYLETMNEIKKNRPEVLGAKSSAQKYPQIVAPIPQQDVVGPFTAPVPFNDVLPYRSTASDRAISRIRKARPDVKLTDQQIRYFYSKYGERLLSEL